MCGHRQVAAIVVCSIHGIDTLLLDLSGLLKKKKGQDKKKG
jgi:hypothetical protein